MRTIFKYTLRFDEVIELLLPRGATIIHFGNQRETPTIWAIVDTGAEEETRRFRLAGTGHDLLDGLASGVSLLPVGSALFHHGDLVFHLFEIWDGVAR